MGEENKPFKMENLFSTDDGTKLFVSKDKTLSGYLRQKATNHNRCKIYGEEDKLSAIFADHILYLTDGKNWNDTADRDAFNSDDSKYKYFAKSFTYSKSESVAMWMLYGGVQKKGVMVEIGAANLNKIINGYTKIVLGNFEGPSDESKFVEGTTIDKEQISHDLVDILYVSSDNENGNIDIKRSDERVSNVSKDCINGLSLVQKDYGWCYENEFRLILRIDKQLCNDYRVAKLNFGDIKLDEKAFYVIKSPNRDDDGHFGDIEYKESTLNSKLNWDLCKGCKFKNCPKCNDCESKPKTA